MGIRQVLIFQVMFPRLDPTKESRRLSWRLPQGKSRCHGYHQLALALNLLDQH